MRFEPVFLPEDRRPNGRVSQTALRHYSQCPRSGFLYFLHRGEAPARELVRGSAFHEIAAHATALAIENGEVQVPPDVVKVLAQEVLAEVPVVWEDHDIVREMSYRWAEQTTFDPSAIVACETLFTLEVAGIQVRAKVDFAEMIEGAAACHIKDYKTARSAPPYEEIARVRPDGTRAAKSFQLVLYALLLAFGVPIRVEGCGLCRGGADADALRMANALMPEGEEPVPVPMCPVCEGSGRIETPEPFSLAANAQRFDCEYVYPSIEDREGNIVTRPTSLTRLELVEWRDSLESTVRSLLSAQETGDWPAIVSDQACGECPAASQCPIPAELRDHRGTVNTPEQAAEAFAVLEREKAEQRARGTELRKFVQEHGPVIFDGKVAEIVMQESERIADKDGLLAAVERAVQFGEPFDRADFVKRVDSYPLKTRDLTAEEVAEMSTPEGGNT